MELGYPRVAVRLMTYPHGPGSLQTGSTGGYETMAKDRPLGTTRTTSGRIDHGDASENGRGRGSQARRWWPTLTILILVGVGLSLLVPAGRHQWALSIIRQPTPYTALYFDHPSSLPTDVPNDQRVSFTFSIANHEGHSLDYRYSVDVSPSPSRIPPATGTAVVASGRSRSIATAPEVACSASPCQVRVTLPDQGRSIDFLVSVGGSGDQRDG